ncbi:hypothetical protein BV898_15391 [Hypsibius exemplaris]|uniref:C2 domain-containing protein n=1 Tax=Hypsibius exemplaris TaxID=2072580 RepID=A0A9X6NDX6_HYPEX|nr:hypothetical protein BV898_15391 [Hypsibius exemplaris]
MTFNPACAAKLQLYFTQFLSLFFQVTLEASSGLPQFIEYEVIKIRRRKDDQDHPKAGAFECASFSAIELAPERTSAIQPRVEDDWIWGNELIFMSLMADVTLTLSPVAWDGAETYRVVRIRIPRRSQVSVSGLARRQWNYSVLSSDVHERQMLLVFRELSGLFRGTTGRVEQAEMGRRIAAANAAFKGDVNSCDCGE